MMIRRRLHSYAVLVLKFRTYSINFHIYPRDQEQIPLQAVVAALKRERKTTSLIIHQTLILLSLMMNRKT